jgi:hypothetical protein
MQLAAPEPVRKLSLRHQDAGLAFPDHWAPATAWAKAESVHRDLSQLTGLFGMFQCFG